MTTRTDPTPTASLAKLVAALVVAALGWGTVTVATRIALREGGGPIFIAGFRTSLVALLAIMLLQMRGYSLNAGDRFWKISGRLGLVQVAIPFTMLTVAVSFASAGFVGVLIATVPLVTAAFAHVLLDDDKLTKEKAFGLVLALTGVAALLMSGESGLSGDNGNPLVAAAFASVGVVSIAYSAVFSKQRAGHIQPLRLTGGQFAVGGPPVLIAALLFEGFPTGISTLGWAMIVYMAALGSLVPFLAYFWVLQRASVTLTVLVSYLVPVIAVSAGVVILDEQVGSGMLLGASLILAGVIVAGRASRKPLPAPL